MSTEVSVETRAEANFDALQNVLKCKWMLSILDRIAEGVARPGALMRSIPQLSKKVMYERLTRLENLGVIRRTVVASKPAEVHYTLTPYGERFSRLLEDLRRL